MMIVNCLLPLFWTPLGNSDFSTLPISNPRHSSGQRAPLKEARALSPETETTESKLSNRVFAFGVKRVETRTKQNTIIMQNQSNAQNASTQRLLEMHDVFRSETASLTGTTPPKSQWP